MRYASVQDYLRAAKGHPKGPLALIFAEDTIELASTVTHHADRGFAEIVVLGAGHSEIAEKDTQTSQIARVDHDVHAPDAVPRAVNAFIAAMPGRWIYYCFNAEYLFHPFGEARDVAEMIAFHTEERRDAITATVVDLYAGDLTAHPHGVDLDDARMDSTGYFALARYLDGNPEPEERQQDVFGGLRWRFEEHVPPAARRIDRVALFRAQRGLELSSDHRFNIPEYNTYACPWHNNLTISIGSFRAAKALRANPGSRFDIDTFVWDNSVRFTWQSQQLMDLGLMEPGQWF